MSFRIASAHIDVALNQTKAIRGLSMLTGAAGVAGAALAALPALGASVAGIGGVLVGAFSGVGEALKGYQTDQKAAAKASGASGAAAAASARQIRDAQQSISDARRNAARVARDAAEAVADAERNAADVSEDVADAINDAKRDQQRVAEDVADAISDAQQAQARTARQGAEAQEAASRKVADALADEQDAQEALTDAREEAARQLDDLREKVSDYALEQEGAAIRVAKAQEKLAEVQADEGASALDLRDALYDLEVARERQSDLTREQAQASAELTEQERLGIDGADKVVSAREKVADAQRKAADVARDAAEANTEAAEKVAEAVESGAEKQRAAAEKVAEAIESGAERQRAAAAAVAQAQRDGAEAQQDAARQVADAVQGLADAQAMAAQSAAAAVGPTSAYADAMAKLTPAGRAFVEQLIRMGPLVRGLRDASQTAFLPGLTQMLKDSEGLFPIFQGFLTETGTMMGDTARRFGELFKTDRFKSNLQAMYDASMPITAAILDGFYKITDSWVNLGAQSGPAAAGFASGLDRLFSGLAGLMDNLAPHMDSFGTLLDGVLGTLGDWLPHIGTALGVIADALVAAWPYIGPVVAGLVGMLVAAKVAQMIYGLVVAFQVLQALFALSPLGLILIALAGLAAGLVYAYNSSETFRNIVNAVFAAVGKAGVWMWENVLRPAFDRLMTGLRAVGDFFGWAYNNLIRPALDGIGMTARWVYDNVLRPAFQGMQTGLRAVGDFFGWVYNNLIKPALDGIGAAGRFVWERVLRPAFDGIGRGVDGVGRAFQNVADWIGRSWNSIREAARAPVQWVVDFVYNNGIRKVWNGIAGLFGLGQLPLVRFATGGIMPGYTPGRDVHLAALSGGEAVMRPEWTRAAGADYVNDANKAARVGGVSGAASFIQSAGLPGYADGGIVGDIWSRASGFIGSLFTGDPAGAVRKLFEGVLGDTGRTPGGGLWRDALVSIPGKLIDAVIGKAKEWLSGSGGAGVGPAVAFAKAQEGKPYRWAGVGPGGYDCSGFMSAIANVIQGKNPYSRRGATGTFPWSGFRVGMGSPFMIGSVTGSPGHMAGTLAGIGVESRGGDGVVVGRRARNHTDPLFRTRAGMVMDSGGAFPSGMAAFNMSGRPERVLSPRQTEAFDRLVDWLDSQAGARQGPAQGDVHVHLEQTSGSPWETGRMVALSLRSVG